MFKKKSFDKYGETVYHGKLKNGLSVYIIPDYNFDCYYTFLTIKYGSASVNQDMDSKLGIAHFLEHMVFKLQDGSDALEAFSNLGAKVNAFTSYYQTTYLFECFEKFDENLRLLFTMVDNHSFNAKSVDKERKIIIEEINMYESDVEVYIDNKFVKNIFSKHPIRYDIGGSVDSVKSINADDLTAAYELFYANSNRFIIICGPVDMKMLETFFCEYECSNNKFVQVPREENVNEPLECPIKEETIIADVSIPKHLIGFKLNPEKKTLKHETIFYFMLSLLIGGSSSYRNVLRSKGLLGNNFSYDCSYEKEVFYIDISNTTEKITEYEEEILKILLQTDKSNFIEENFNRIKRAFLGEFIFGLNQVRTKAELYQSYRVDDFDLFKMVDLINEIVFPDVLEAFEEMKRSPYTILRVMKKQ